MRSVRSYWIWSSSTLTPYRSEPPLTPLSSYVDTSLTLPMSRSKSFTPPSPSLTPSSNAPSQSTWSATSSFESPTWSRSDLTLFSVRQSVKTPPRFHAASHSLALSSLILVDLIYLIPCSEPDPYFLIRWGCHDLISALCPFPQVHQLKVRGCQTHLLCRICPARQVRLTC